MGGTIGDVELPPRDRVNTISHAETSALVRTLADKERKVVVAYNGYPVFDMATAIDQWFNAKVGNSKPIIKSSAFVKLLTKELGLARVVGDELQWVEGMETNITLTFVRNRPSTNGKKKKDQSKFENSFKKDSSMDFEKVKAFFEENVEVKMIDSSNLRPLSGPKRNVMERTSNLVKESAKFMLPILK